LLASILTVLVCGAAAATIVITLEVGSTGVTPWNRTFDVANGAHILVTASSEQDALAVADLPGVAESDEPLPRIRATLVIQEKDVRVLLSGLTGPPSINLPLLTRGSALSPGGIVLERSMATALGVDLGTKVSVVTVDGPLELEVLGIAISPSQPRYPRSNPGIGWVTR